MKYEMIKDDTTVLDGHVLHRIRCTEQGPHAKEGDLGGYVEKKENLSGDAWVGEGGYVYGGGKVYGSALVVNARVFEEGTVRGDAKVSGGAWVRSTGCVEDDAIVDGWVTVRCRIAGHAYVTSSLDFCYFEGYGRISAYKTVEGDIEVAEPFSRCFLEDYKRKYESCGRKARKACKHLRKLILYSLYHG